MKLHRTGAAALLVMSMGTAPATGRGDAASAATSAPSTASSTAPSTRPATTTGRTDGAIAAAQARLAQSPQDTSAKKALARAMLQKVRESADPAYYAQADKILETLGGIRATDPEVLLLEGTLLLARHQFIEALDVGKRAAAALPSNPTAQGILVDAYNELGRYTEALTATQRMLDLRPDLAALSRASYARELRGDLPGAIEVMQQAVVAGQGSGENVAYVQTLLANLLLTLGDVTQASAVLADALRSFPGFAPTRAGQAAVLFARGRPADAARLMASVVETQPQLAYAIAQGDYYAAAGMTKQATDSYALVDAIAALQRSNGVDIDIDLAVYRADHGLTNGLLDSTRKALARRPGVVGQDALAWVLHRLGKHREASATIAKVIALGDRDPMFRFHAAAIAAAANNPAEAKAQLDVLLRGNSRVAGIPQAELSKLASSLGKTVPPVT